MKEHHPNWPKVPDYTYRILSTRDCRFRKTRPLFYLISLDVDTDKIYLYSKHLNKEKYQPLINKFKNLRLNRFNDCKAFQNSNDRDNAYKNIEEYNPNK